MLAQLRSSDALTSAPVGASTLPYRPPNRRSIREYPRNIDLADRTKQAKMLPTRRRAVRQDSLRDGRLQSW